MEFRMKNEEFRIVVCFITRLIVSRFRLPIPWGRGLPLPFVLRFSCCKENDGTRDSHPLTHPAEQKNGIE